jgi:hypothetical protein
MTAHLTLFQRDLARRLRMRGMNLRAIAKEVGCIPAGIVVVLRGHQERFGRLFGVTNSHTRERQNRGKAIACFTGLTAPFQRAIVEQLSAQTAPLWRIDPLAIRCHFNE